MRTVQIADLVKDVKIVIDENIATDPVLADDDNQLELEELIAARAVDAVRSIHEAAPSDMLDDGDTLPVTGIVTNQDGSGYVPLPDDFMRLVIFQLATWNRPVVTPIADTDPRYPMQKSRFLGVRGGPDKPVCAITTGSAGKVLEFYSVVAGTSATVSKAKYLPLPKVENNAIKVCTKLYNAVVYECAALVALTLKDDNAKNFFEVAKSYL